MPNNHLSLKFVFGTIPAICAVRAFALTFICPIQRSTAVHLDMRGNGISHSVTLKIPLGNKSVIFFVC
jgi:hypothetical protein